MAEVWKSKEKVVLQHWIDCCLYQAKDLTAWELKFLHSIEEQLERTGRLSERQQDILENIYAEKTS